MTDRPRQHRDNKPASAAAFWKRLERMLETPELRARLERDHPGGAAELADALSRRSFMKLMGASLALAGLDACTRMPAERILPYVKQPPELAPGVPQYYATSMVIDGFATGLVVETHEGRPTKIEGNPDHPASLGAAGVLEQASVLQLYDPDRARYVRQGRRRASWQSFTAAMSPAALRNRVGARGAGLRLLLQPTSSGVEAELLQRIRAQYPEAGIHFYSPLRSGGGAEGSLGAGAALLPLYDFRAADVVLVIDDDPLASGPFQLRYARDFADRRRTPSANMNRLYVVESAFTVTGAAADHRLRARPSEIEPALAHLSSLLGSSGTPAAAGGGTAGISASQAAWLESVARDLRAHAGRALVIVGERQSPRARALGRAINQGLGADGATVRWVASPLVGAGDAAHGLAPLLDALRAKSVDTLVISGVNLAYAAPGDAGTPTLLNGVRSRVYHGLYDDETARGAEWTVPAAHYLESWGEARAYDGTLSVVQPVLRPLFESRTTTELLAVLAGVPQPSALALLRDTWNRRGAGGSATSTASAAAIPAAAGGADDEAWRDFLRRGFVPGSASSVGSAAPPVAPPGGGGTPPSAPGGDHIELVFLPDSRLLDGRFANNGWLQELPDPVTKLTWENAAQLSPATAQRLGLATGDMVELHANGATARLPAIVVPGLADDTAVVQFGYGRAGAESVARGAGANVYPLWRAGSFVADASIARSPGHRELPITQEHWSMQGRDPARVMSVAEYARAPAPPRRRALTLYEPQSPQGVSPHQWAMTIDLGACIGCGACVVGCQAENNIPVVGRDGVVARREMHWIRIDRYLEPGTGEADPRVVTEPMLCQHCEKAPCEYVCPVEATEHSSDGLNEMIYNRCVGTRFCSNNCPYKVRRFNWFDYNAHLSELELMVKNPDVTVRERGVMEKCSFCVQRIREAEIAAGREGRPLHGSEVQTACQQACPTRAIVFGSLTERDSEVVRLREDRRAFAVLESLGTEPRVRYLARVRNPNPELEKNA